MVSGGAMDQRLGATTDHAVAPILPSSSPLFIIAHRVYIEQDKSFNFWSFLIYLMFLFIDLDNLLLIDSGLSYNAPVVSPLYQSLIAFTSNRISLSNFGHF